jgi:PAS domain-containing protein
MAAAKIGPINDSQRQLASILTSLDKGVMIRRREGGYSAINAAARRILKIEERDLVDGLLIPHMWKLFNEQGESIAFTQAFTTSNPL